MESSQLYSAWLGGSLIAVQVFSYLLLQQYSSKSNASFTVKVLTYTGWFLGFATIAILPLDIFLATNTNGMEALQY